MGAGTGEAFLGPWVRLVRIRRHRGAVYRSAAARSTHLRSASEDECLDRFHQSACQAGAGADLAEDPPVLDLSGGPIPSRPMSMGRGHRPTTLASGAFPGSAFVSAQLGPLTPPTPINPGLADLVSRRPLMKPGPRATSATERDPPSPHPTTPTRPAQPCSHGMTGSAGGCRVARYPFKQTVTIA